MSSRTRREQRKKRAEMPGEADWLWSCLPATPLKEIARLLSITQEPQHELSARLWADDRVSTADLYQALFPHMPLKLHMHANWDAINDNLTDACADGLLLVIRQVPIQVPQAVRILLGMISSRCQERGRHFFESRPGARFACVLEGWTQRTIRVRTSLGSHVFRVTPLSNPSDLLT